MRCFFQLFFPLPFSFFFSSLLILFLFLFFALTPAFAQQFATLRLTITDPQGSAIAQAKVAVRNVDTGVVHDELTDPSGVVNIPGLSAGQYMLEVDADAFAPYQAPLVLTLGQVAQDCGRRWFDGRILWTEVRVPVAGR